MVAKLLGQSQIRLVQVGDVDSPAPAMVVDLDSADAALAELRELLRLFGSHHDYSAT